MTKELKLKPHTIVMTIAPSNAGKTYFCENVIVPFLDSHGIKNKYFSSDAIRRQLLATYAHKHAGNMQMVSKQAFSILENGVDNFTQYPVNCDVVIVDATHLSKLGRSRIIEIAKKNHYSLVGLLFNYKDKADYFKYAEGVSNKVIADHIRSFKDKTLKELERDIFSEVITIDSIDFSNIQISYQESNDHALVQHKRIGIIGDPHGCLDELIECVTDEGKGITYNAEKNKLEVISQDDYVHHIIVGDFIDKGPKIKEMIEFLYNNMEFFTFVKGNHEHWVYEYLNKRLKPSATNDELIEKWFDTVKILQPEEAKDLKDKFFTLFSACRDFVLGDSFIVTHAPCENKYLGKSDKVSLKKQRNFMYPKKADFPDEESYLNAREAAFKFLVTDADTILPYHVFGHTPVPNVYKNKNKICVDTGCATGGYLSCVIFEKKKNPFIKKYKSRQEAKEPILAYFRTKENEVDLHSLEYDLQTRLRWAATNHLNFISGTMSPADKKENDLESLEAGLEYFRSNGVTRLILQPKFMGSRCQVLLHKNDVLKCKAFSRNGYEINNGRLSGTTKTLEEMFVELQAKFRVLLQEQDAEYILFDGEMLPWSVMGKELIERDFRLAAKALDTEIYELENNGFDVLFEKLREKNSKPFTEKTPEFNKSNKKAFEEVEKEIQPIAQMQTDLDAYKKQLIVFGEPGELEYKPFSILKIVKNDGTEENWVSSNKSNVEIWGLLNSQEPHALLDLETDTLKVINCPNVSGTFLNVSQNDTLRKIFWTFITEQREMEGIVIKPQTVYIPNVAPYMKVRNKEYLRLTYGMDYQSLAHKTEKLLKGKSIKRKLETSIKEWELGRRMLDVPMKDISTSNGLWVTLALQLISEMDKEQELDPRL